MAERLTFNYGVAPFSREVRGRGEVSTASERGLPEAAAPFLPPVERPDWAYWGVFAFTALLFFRPQDTLPFLARMNLAELAAIAALVAMLGHRLTRRLPLVRTTPELIGIGAMMMVMAATIPFSVWPGGSFGTLTDVYLKVVLIFILMVNSIRGPKILNHFTWLIVAAMGYVAARGVFDFARGANLWKGERLSGAVGGLLENPNDLATNMVTFLPLAAMLALSRGRPLPRALAGTIALLMFATILFTKSRAGLLGLVAMGLVLVLQTRHVRRGASGVIVVCVLATTPFLPSWVWTRAASIVNPDEDAHGSREQRKDVMRDAWDAFVANPLTGVGAGQFRNYNPEGRRAPWLETHNVVLQVAAELGIFGVLAFVYLLWRAVYAIAWTKRMFPRAPPRARPAGPRAPPSTFEAFRPAEREQMRMHSAAMTACFAGWFVCAQFASIGYYWTFYYLFALIVIARLITVERLEAARRAAQRPEQAWKEKRTA